VSSVKNTAAHKPNPHRSLASAPQEKKRGESLKPISKKIEQSFETGGFLKAAAKSLVPSNSDHNKTPSTSLFIAAAANYKEAIQNGDTSKIIGYVGSEVHIGATALAAKQGLTTAVKAMRPKASSLGKQMVNQVTNSFTNRNITQPAVNLRAPEVLPAPVLPLTFPTGSSRVTRFDRQPTPIPQTDLEPVLASAAARRPASDQLSLATVPSQPPMAIDSPGSGGRFNRPLSNSRPPSGNTLGGHSGGGSVGGSDGGGGSPPGSGPPSSSGGEEPKQDWNDTVKNSKISHFSLDPNRLTNKDLSGKDFTKWTFKNRNLSGSNLSNAKLSEVDLSGSNLSNADLSKADLLNANFSFTNLYAASFQDAIAKKATFEGVRSKAPLYVSHGVPTKAPDFSGADLTEANFTNADLSLANFEGANLSGAKLISTRLVKANLQKANLNNAIVENAQVRGANFTGAQARGINFSQESKIDPKLLEMGIEIEGGTKEALEILVEHKVPLNNMIVGIRNDLTGAQFNGMNAPGAKIYTPKLSGVQLQSAQLQGVTLSRDSDLSRANLRDADLSGANLHSSNLQNSDLEGSDLSLAILSDADLTGANLTNARRANIIMNSRTKLDK
jgi:uncharacterized protein YjbI with pentapeptide repeats